MRLGTCCLLTVAIIPLVLVAPIACAGEGADVPGKELTLEEKVEQAHKLAETVRSGSKHELLELIHEVGIANFLKPVLDDEEKLIYLVDGIALGMSTVEGSMTRADIATYLLKDKRPKVRRMAVKYITMYALYCDKPYVNKVLFELYEQATDDADLRVALATAIGQVGSPDREGKEPRPYPGESYDEVLKHVPTLFKDPDPRVRRAAVDSLLRARSVMHRVKIGVLEEDPDPGVRAAVLEYYRETKIKTKRVIELGIKAFGGSNIDELEAAFKYAKQMKLDEACDAMLGAVKRLAKPAGDDLIKARIRGLKVRILKYAMERMWKEAAPHLLWIAENDTDLHIRDRAAYAMLKVLGQTTVSLGTAEEVFPETMVDAERAPLMTAFKAWVIESYQGQGETPEVKRLREKAQIEFSGKVATIATQRLLDRDVANKRRGLELVFEMGPEEYASQVETMREVHAIFQSLEAFQDMTTDVKPGRQVARVFLGFVDRQDPQVKKYALGALGSMAAYCDKDVFIPVLAKLAVDADPQVANMARQLAEAIQAMGYSVRDQERLRYREGPADSDDQ